MTKRRAKQLLREKSKFDKKKMKNFKEYADLIKKNFKLQRYDFDRYDFKKYAEPENFWVKNFDSGQTHPHLMSLEILVETGIIGFSMYLFVLVLLLKISINSVSSDSAKFWLIAAFLAWLPLNTHLAFYGSYWASVAWIFLALGLGGAKSGVDHPK